MKFLTKKIILSLVLFSQLPLALEFINKDIQDMPIFRGHASFGDLNGDGLKDIFVSELDYKKCRSLPPSDCYEDNLFHDSAKIFIADVKGGFSELIQEIEINETTISPVNLGFGSYIISYKSSIADMNNDGLNDIVTSDGRILINNGHAQFTSSVNTEIPAVLKSVFTVDFNNDGIYEIVNDNQIYQRTSLSPLTYEKNESFNINSDRRMAFADFNNDNYDDIISFGTSASLRIYVNDKHGNFNVMPYNELSEEEPLNLLVADINGDTLVDIVLSDNSVLINQGNFQFTEMPDAINIEGSIYYDQDQANNYVPIKLIKYNNDTFPDLVLRLDDRIYYVLINDGHGQFNISKNYFSSAISVYVPLFFDFNNDGFDDMVSSYSYQPYSTEIYNENSMAESILLDPMVFGLNGLFINSSEGSYFSAAHATSIPYKSYMPIDINNDGSNEYVPIERSYHGLSSCDYLSNTVSIELCSESKPYYLNNLDHTGYQVNNLDLFDSSIRVYKGNSKGDMNNDGLNDLIVSYLDCETLCDIEKTKVFYNSELGFRTEDSQEFDVIAKGLITDINSDGIKETVEFNWQMPFLGTSLQITELNLNGTFNVFDFDMGFTQGNFSIHDLNVDGNSDFVYIDINSRMTVHFGEGVINALSEPTQIVSRLTQSYNFDDFDNDGDLDLFTVNDNVLYRYQNDGQGNFFSETDTSIVQMFYNPNGLYLQDFDADGIPELVMSSNSGIAVYQLENNQYHQIFSHFFELPTPVSIVLKPSMIFDDLDKDGKLDMFFADQIILSREFKFLTGLNYDPAHNGHGVSLENVGENLFYTIFYTYDNDGQPQWYSDLGLFEMPTEDYWNIGVLDDSAIHYLYDYDNQTIYADSSSQHKGSLIYNKCSDIYSQINFRFSIGETGLGLPLSHGEWCSQPIVAYENRPITDDMSGLWWAGQEESGWGWSVELYETETGTDMVVILYYYDAQGNPRWLIGQQSGFQAGQEITLDMNMVQGYGRSSPVNDLQQIPAGTMSLTLNQASSNILLAGTVSVDLTYPGDEGGHWVRDNIPIALFSKPRR